MDGLIYFTMGVLFGFSLREFIATVSQYLYNNFYHLLARVDDLKNDGRPNR